MGEREVDGEAGLRGQPAHHGGGQAVERCRNRDQSQPQKSGRLSGEMYPPLIVMADRVGPFPAGDMHDFFVGLMGKRNLQAGRSKGEG